MLRLLDSTPDDRGLYKTGAYSMRISRIVDGVILADDNTATFDFSPNPTDIDDIMQFPNVVQPDHAGGFYVDVNEMGMKTISIRGTTGQFPAQSSMERSLIAVPEAASSISNLRGVLPSRAKSGMGMRDGYNIWISLFNFFKTWARLVRFNPHEYAMLFLNSKDAEIFQVLPMTFRKTRTSARPLTYGYSIDLQVIGEREAVFSVSWIDRMNDIRLRIKRWQTAINNSLLVASQIMQNVSLGSIGTVYGPVTSGLQSMTSGLQGYALSAKKIIDNAAYSHERLKEVAEEMVSADTYSAGANSAVKTMGERVPLRSIPEMYPPTQDAVFNSLYPDASDILQYMAQISSQIALGTGEVSNLPLDDPSIENYADALRLYQEVVIAVDSAPLPNTTPAGYAGQETRDMHRAARIGSAGIIDGRSNELASASLAGETTLLNDSTYSVDTRHAVRQQKSIEAYTLSHLAAIVTREWSRANNERISPQLTAFREWYLGMRDPSTFSPVYRNVKVGITDTIYSLAKLHLGTWRRWTEIALVNSLKYPYISAQGGPYQVKPGDYIQVPVENSSIPAEVLEDLIQITDTHDKLNTYDIFLGFDVEVNARTGDMTYSVYDVGHVGGIQAFQQEVSLVLEGSGGVTPDRQAGPLIRIGTKSRGKATLEFWRTLLLQWFSQDRRVAEVIWLRVWQESDAIFYSSKLKFENLDTAVTVAGRLRN